MFWKSFLWLHNFWVKKCKNQLFEENKRFEFSFYRIQIQVVAILPSWLEKTPNTWHFALWQIFYEFLKIDNFFEFSKNFGNHQLQLLKSLYMSRAMGKCVFGVNLAILRFCDFHTGHYMKSKLLFIWSKYSIYWKIYWNLNFGRLDVHFRTIVAWRHDESFTTLRSFLCLLTSDHRCY